MLHHPNVQSARQNTFERNLLFIIKVFSTLHPMNSSWWPWENSGELHTYCLSGFLTNQWRWANYGDPLLKKELQASMSLAWGSQPGSKLRPGDWVGLGKRWRVKLVRKESEGPRIQEPWLHKALPSHSIR